MMIINITYTCHSNPSDLLPASTGFCISKVPPDEEGHVQASTKHPLTAEYPCRLCIGIPAVPTLSFFAP